jgi:hypothetical protein
MKNRVKHEYSYCQKCYLGENEDAGHTIPKRVPMLLMKAHSGQLSKNGRRQLLIATETCTEKYVEKRMPADPNMDQRCQEWGEKIIQQSCKEYDGDLCSRDRAKERRR